MIAALAREARRLRRFNPQTYSDAVLARRYGVGIDELREAIEQLAAQDRRAQRERRVTKPQRPASLEEERRERTRRLAALDDADTRDLNDRLLGNPPPGRSALDRKSGP